MTNDGYGNPIDTVECPHKRIGERPCEGCAPKEHEMEGQFLIFDNNTQRILDSKFASIEEIQEFFTGWVVQSTDDFLVLKVVGGIKNTEDPPIFNSDEMDGGSDEKEG